MEDVHRDISFLNASHSPLDFFVEDVSKISECCDEVANGVIITEFSSLVVLLGIEFSRDSGSLKLAF